MKAKYLMTRNVIVSRPEMSIEEAKELLSRYHISGLPVLDDQKRVVGVLSQTDVLTKMGRRVGELMTSPAVTVDEEAGMEEVAALMAAKDINRIPVLCGGRLVGIISRADVVRYVATRRAWLDLEGQSG